MDPLRLLGLRLHPHRALAPSLAVWEGDVCVQKDLEIILLDTISDLMQAL